MRLRHSPVEDSTNEWWNKSNSSLRTSNGLGKGEQERQITMNSIFFFQFSKKDLSINMDMLLIEYKIYISIWFLIYFAAWMPSQVDASLIKMRSLLTPSPSYRAINLFAFSILASLLKDNLASTSVETLPGIIFKISLPNRTQVISRAASTCSAKVLKKRILI